MRVHHTAITGLMAILAGSFSPARSHQSQWLDVPYVHQLESGCGAASISMVMQYWVRQQPQLDPAAADSDQIYKLLSPSPRKGISGQALKQYLGEHGFDAFIFAGELLDLQHHVEKGRPLVVCLAPKGAHAPLHYVVVVGFATDYCVTATAHDAVRLGHETAVLTDATMPVNVHEGDGRRALDELREAGVTLASTLMR